MTLRFAPNLESLDERLTLSTTTGGTQPFNHKTEQVRQSSVIVDLAVPDLRPKVAAQQTEVPTVTDLVIGTYNGPVVASVTGQIIGVAADTPVGATPKDWVFGTELPPDANRQRGASHVQGWMLIAKQRAIQSTAGELALIGESVAEVDRIGPFFQFKSNRLGPAGDDGRKFKMLVAPLVLDPDTARPYPDDLVGWNYANSSSGRPADPFSFTLDGRASGI